jgi:hypothetical protein
MASRQLAPATSEPAAPAAAARTPSEPPPGHSGGRPAPTWLRLLSGATLAVGLVHAAFFAYAAVQRFRHPVELEWMSGAVLDHVERVLEGKPLYVAPSADFIPFLYPPLFYWLSAAVAKALPLQAACRVVSLTATLATAALSYRAARRLGATSFWALVAVSLFVGAYSFTGYWYDLERSDTLLMALVTGGLVIALERKGAAGAAVAGALVAGAFLAKQPASVFFVAGIGGLLLARSYRRAVAFAAGGALVLLPAIAYLNATSDGWFWFYCVKMPTAHGIKAELFTVFFVVDATKAFALVIATAAVLGRFGTGAVAALRGRPLDEKEALFGAFLAASLFTSATSRLHVGGYLNVLMFWTTFAAIAFAVEGTRLASTFRAPTVRGLLVGVALLQLGHFLYDPEEAAPSARRVRDAKVVEARVRDLEKEGRVLVPGRGHLARERHFHAIALMDVLRGGLPIPHDLEVGIRERRYAAYVIDEFGELTLEAIVGHRSELFELVTRHYFVAQRMDDREPPPLVGWIAHPSWVLRPRKEPLTLLTPDQLARRQLLERGIAEMRMRAVQAGARQVDDGDDIESLAAAMDAGEP